MYTNRGHLKDPKNAAFKSRVMKVLKADRHSAVTAKEKNKFKKTWQAYQTSHEATLRLRTCSAYDG